MRDHIRTLSGATMAMALTAGTAVSVSPEAVDLLSDLNHQTTAQKIQTLKAAVRDGLITRSDPSAGPITTTQFGDSSPKPGDAFKDK